MRLTKKQSRILAATTVVGFFAIAFLFSHSPSDDVDSELALTTTSEPEESPVAVPNSIEEPVSQTKMPETSSNQDSSNFSLKDFHRSEVKDGRTLWEVKGTNAKYFPEKNSIQIEQGNLIFFNTEDDVIHLKAKRAILYMEGAGVKKAEAFDGVELVYNSDVTINTKEATYYLDRNLVEAPGFVTIESDGLYIQGEELEANVVKKTAKLNKNVESTIKPRGK